MKTLGRMLRRLQYWLRFRSQQEELREELRQHREMLQVNFERDGFSPVDAAAAARRAMGDETGMREYARGIWFSPKLEAVVQDWRYAWRGLWRTPSFTIVAVVSLALGIGANTAIFGVIHSVLLARVPVPNASELVLLRRNTERGLDERFSQNEFVALASSDRKLSMFSTVSADVELGADTVSVNADAVHGSYFESLQLRAERGRLLSSGDDDQALPVAVVSSRFWRGSMNADGSVLGRVLKIDGHPFTIVGVAATGFAGLRFPASTDVFIPLRSATAVGLIHGDNGKPYLTIFSRENPEQATQDNTRLTAAWRNCCSHNEQLTATTSRVDKPTALEISDISRGVPQPKVNLRGQYRNILIALMAGVGILLLAACANVANLLLARSSARTGELAVRLALGASRSRLVSQLMIESMQLSVVGALCGILLARWATNVLTHANIGMLSGAVSSSISTQVLVFTATVCLLSGILFGLAPALRVLSSDLISPLKQGARRSVSSQRGLLDQGLVAVQIALAILLVSGASLLVQTLRNLQGSSAGFESDNRLAVTIETRRTLYESQGMTAPLSNEILRRFRAVPGVKSAALASSVPIYGGRGATKRVTVRGSQASDESPAISFVAITSGYFDALGIPLREGRVFRSELASGTEPHTRDVVVNELFARQFFAGRSAIGQVFEDADDNRSTVTENRVIGVVGNSKYASVRAPAEPMYFIPVTDHSWPFLVLVAEYTRDATSASRAVAPIVNALAPGIRLGDVELISTSVADALVRERTSATLASIFGAIALGLVAVGLYGVMLFQVSERVPEIGIRIALGARPQTVIALIFRQSLTMVTLGLLGGVPLAMFAGKAVSSQLYGVAPYNVWALLFASGCLLAVTVVACLVPIRRALNVDPITALRAG